jgi:hypothetical protein
MTVSSASYVMLFRAVSHALKAEKILKAERLPHRLIPIPKQISSDCGICLRFDERDRLSIEEILRHHVEIEGIRALNE